MTTRNADLCLGRVGSILQITIDRPDARNALNRATRVALVGVCAEADQDPTISAVVLTGAGSAFSAGVDLKEALSDAPYYPPPTNPGQALRAMTTPVVAAVNGACVSGGLEVALACSLIVASDQATFADTHARVGLLPSWGLSAMLPQAIGIRRARQMALTGDFITASRALEWGLVNEVVPHARLLERAYEIAESVAGVPEPARRAILSLYARGEGAPLASALGLEAETRALWKVDAPEARARFVAARERGSRSS